MGETQTNSYQGVLPSGGNAMIRARVMEPDNEQRRHLDLDK